MSLYGITFNIMRTASLLSVLILLSSCLATRVAEESSLDPTSSEPAEVASVSGSVTLPADPVGSAPGSESSVEESRPDAEAPPIPEPPPPPPDEAYAEMSAAVAVGDIEAAIERFEEAFSSDPQDPETKILFSNLQMAAGELDDARSTLGEVLEAEPENVGALFALALIASADGREEEQSDLLHRVLDIEPDEARAHAALGELSLRREEIGEAISSFERSIELDPESVVPRIGLGNALIREERYEEAVVELSVAADLEPEYEFTFVDRSRARLELGDPAGAEADLTRAIEIAPDYYWNYIDRGRVRLLGIDDAAGALEDFQQAIMLDSSYFYPYVYRGLILDRMDRRSAAIADYERVMLERDDYHYLYEPLALNLYLEKRWLDSIPYFRRAWELNIDEFAYPFLIALSYFRSEDTKNGEEVLNAAISSFPRDSLQYELARLFLEPGYDAHVTTLVSQESNIPHKTRMLYYLAEYYLLNGRTSLGQKYLIEVEDAAYPGMIEHRLARVELDEYR